MSAIDWIVLSCTILFIVAYGIYKSRGQKNIDGYLLGDRSMPWYSVGLSVMATQASAITFLSAPGLAYSDGMRFVQFYFGLPLAMIILCITFVPIYHKLKVYTAYEFLEQRFDLKTRALTAFLFLIQRGLSTGITIYAPSIILSTILNIDTTYTTLFIGSIVVLYTVYGGTKAVSYTQMLQMSIIFCGLFLAGFMVVQLLPDSVGFTRALDIAGKMDKMNVIDWHFDMDNKYTVWTGIIGGLFLQLSYFGTDQSQVGRYLTGSSVGQSRMGLLMNAMLKIPMQFMILLIGILVFAFYQYQKPPVFFNTYEVNKIENSSFKAEFKEREKDFDLAFANKKEKVIALETALDNKKNVVEASAAVKAANKNLQEKRANALAVMKKNDANADLDDTNYVFLRFVTQYLPKGLIGLLIAIVCMASMGSTASALNSLASTTSVDIYKRLINKSGTDLRYLNISKITTFFWGVVSIGMALYASKLGNLLEAVNILGSLFYGTILGVFLVAFYVKSVGGKAVFYAALLTEVFVFIAYKFNWMAYLWLNLFGCALVIGFGLVLEKVFGRKTADDRA
ncbi:MAG: sodium:solute symporter [Bacteroidetes bacterium]|nr:sodium:solute symporter [Bacteroidota bacterium]MBU1373471.1 sodium:solute symporter [Bacteroidota bacterium]MBU1485229.1 sodium:solute symporter [Bacteroidota bacterium]MBU1761257.1 sodium:solute symporter [Bacteroidota bacterium]MBU2266983.1 sodium:solute symporter [Bacteroidota bacterium]